MSVQVEKLEKNMAKLTIEVSAEEFEAAIEKAYQKEKGKIALPGFRKGKAPRKMIEKMYGAGVFYEDAANMVIPEAYDKALKECEEEIVSRPSIDVTQIEAGKPFIFTAEVALKPEVTLGEYKGVEIPKKEIQVTEEEVQAAIDKERDSNSRTIDVDDRPVVLSVEMVPYMSHPPVDWSVSDDTAASLSVSSDNKQCEFSVRMLCRKSLQRVPHI